MSSYIVFYITFISSNSCQYSWEMPKTGLLIIYNGWRHCIVSKHWNVFPSNKSPKCVSSVFYSPNLRAFSLEEPRKLIIWQHQLCFFFFSCKQTFNPPGSEIIRTTEQQIPVCFGISIKGQWAHNMFHYKRQMWTKKPCVMYGLTLWNQYSRGIQHCV